MICAFFSGTVFQTLAFELIQCFQSVPAAIPRVDLALLHDPSQLSDDLLEYLKGPQRGAAVWGCPS
jgi:hypothetical protein